MAKIKLSELDHLWLIDLDGTILGHNSHKSGSDYLLEGVREFWTSIPSTDMIILITARSANYKNKTEEFLNENAIRFNRIIYDVPVGERILINDRKTSGLLTALSLNLERNKGFGGLSIELDKNL